RGTRSFVSPPCGLQNRFASEGGHDHSCPHQAACTNRFVSEGGHDHSCPRQAQTGKTAEAYLLRLPRRCRSTASSARPFGRSSTSPPGTPPSETTVESGCSLCRRFGRRILPSCFFATRTSRSAATSRHPYTSGVLSSIWIVFAPGMWKVRWHCLDSPRFTLSRPTSTRSSAASLS